MVRLCGDAHALTHPVTARTRGPIALRFVGGETGDSTNDTDLPLELTPVEHERRVRIAVEIGGFGALEVRVEGEAALVGTAHQDRPGRHGATGPRRRQCHGLGLPDVGVARFLEPRTELHDRVGRHGFGGQFGHVTRRA
jgi:hypothetical protein